MAPRAGAQRRDKPQNQNLYNLGERGRKTGVFLPDTGVRDEHGMEPLDNLFSSPEKENPTSRTTNGLSTTEEDMDISTTSGPDPAALLNGNNSARRSIPHARSPLKTYLQSPAIKNPRLVRHSSASPDTEEDSPVMGSPDKAVQRRLDFSTEKRQAKTNGVNGRANGHDASEDEEDTILRGHRDESPLANGEDSMQMIEPGDDMVEDEPQEDVPSEPASPEDESMAEVVEPVEKKSAPAKRGRPGRKPAGPKKAAVVEASPEPEPGQEDDEAAAESEEAPPPRKRGRPARPKQPTGAAEPDGEEEASVLDSAPAAKKRGRPIKGAQPADAPQDSPPRSPKRRRSGRNSTGGEDEEDEVSEPKAKKAKSEEKTQPKKAGRPKKAAADEEAEPSSKPAKAAKQKAAPPREKAKRKRKSSGVAVPSPMVVQRGPPMPKARGLVSLRREAVGGEGVLQTRSGRSSFKPLAFWRGERVEYNEERDEDLVEDKFIRSKAERFFMPTVKEVIRADELADERPRKTKRGRPGPRGKRRSRADGGGGGGDDDDDDEGIAEPWEEEDGHVEGEVCVWEPEHEFNPPGPDDPTDLVPEQLAISNRAIATREIRDASFRFAKTLTTPFFATGVVDLPPGSEKKPKNSRKMQLAFFVHYGRVEVQVNETVFRISKGGTWFVPRGNYYSIKNDYDRPARLFFSQGCENWLQPEAGEEDEPEQGEASLTN